MIRWQDLIATSRSLTTPQQPNIQPLEDSLRRAISTAYYAMFHALAISNANCLIGSPYDPITRHAWSRAYRGLEHRDTKRNLQRNQVLFSRQVRIFADTFVQMQAQRHNADYDPDQTFTLSATLNWIDRAEHAIVDFMSVPVEERKAVAIQSLIRGRTN